MNTHLQLRLIGEKNSEAQIVRFSASPIRVGRNPLNDLQLKHAEVSQWHGAIHFDDDKISYTDLGSKNGSRIDGKRIAANEPFPLQTDSTLQLGGMKIELVGLEKRESPAGEKEQQGGYDPPTVIGIAALRVLGDLSKDKSSNPAADKPSLAEGERKSHVFHEGVLEALGDKAQSPKSEIPFSPELSQELSQWLKNLLGNAPRKNDREPTPRQILERSGALLRAFCQAYIELNRGIHQAEADMGLEHKNAQNSGDAAPFTRASSAEAMLADLFAPDVEHATRVYELNRAFAQVAIHQVALISALMEGVRGLLEFIEPTQLENAVKEMSSREAPLARFWPPLNQKLWSLFQTRFADLMDADGFTRRLFGSRFARAYYVFSGRSKQSDKAKSSYESPLR